MTTGSPCARFLERHLLGKPLRALVVPGHVGDRHRRVLVARLVLRHADAADRAGVNDALDAGAVRRFQQIACAVDIRAIEIVGMFRPEPIIGGHMKHQSAAWHRTFERSRIAQIAGDALDIQVRALTAGRHRARTRYPRSVSRRATCHPRKPLAPVTRAGFTDDSFDDCAGSGPSQIRRCDRSSRFTKAASARRETCCGNPCRSDRRPWGNRCRWHSLRPSFRRAAAFSIRYSIPVCRLMLRISPPASNPRIAQAVCEACSVRRERVVVVAGAAFAPAAIGVLVGAEPFERALNLRFAIVHAGRLQAAQGEERAVKVIDAPAAIPASVRLLGIEQVLDCRAVPPDGSAVKPHRHSASITRPGDIRARWVEHRVVIGKRNFAQELPVVVDVERRPAAVFPLHRQQPVDRALLACLLLRGIGSHAPGSKRSSTIAVSSISG